MTVTSSTQSTVPTCFGKDWDKAAPECAGGPDPNYPQGGYRREQCNFFQSCGARKFATQGTLVPATQLVRPPLVTPPPTGPQTFADHLRQVDQTRNAAIVQMQRTNPTMTGPVHYPAATYQLNYTSPNFLSAPEEQRPGESLRAVLVREVLRAMLKALGHAVAHFFDTRVWGRKNTT